MINLNISKNIFNATYFPYLSDYSHRYEIYYGGAGSGKSVFVAQKLIIKALREKRRILITRKYATTLKDSVFDLIISILKKWEIYKFCKVNLSNYTITLSNESVILFKGLDDEEKIKSILDITDIWMEEATEFTEDEFTQLDLRVRVPGYNSLQLFLSFNPVSKANWVYKKWFDPTAEIDKDKTFILHTTYKDNKYLPQEYIDSLKEKEKSNPTFYRIYALGEFCSLDKLIYTNWEIKAPTGFEGITAIGLDFGYSNDTTALVASIINTESKEIYIFKEWGDTGKTNQQIASVIKSLGFSKSVIIADSAEPKSIEEIRREGISRIRESVKGADSVIHGIQQLQGFKIYVNPSCTETITELENYSWQKDKKTNEYINKPIDTFNHFLDSLRYSLQCCEKHKLQTISKAKLGL